ncbi:RHS repeat-associated core domain-containing protein, partial [Clostridium sporogenes]|uniref:RHS repeat-associated core domain-containing protein n=2 Tax=Clostridiaceae TaxID=31979 RepID=UPI000AB9DEA4
SWGKLLGIEGELKDTLGVKNPYRYKGYRYDNETGIYYLKSRYYNPELGRFISADAVVGKTGEILSHNLFSYSANNPVNVIDEDGNRFEWIKSKWNSFKKAVSTGVKKVVSGAKRVAARVVSGVKKAVRSASTWVRNKYRGYTNTARNTYRRTKKWVHNTARTVSRKAQNVSHSVVKHTQKFVNNHRRAIEITRNVVAIASIALIAIPLVAPVAIPAMAIAALGIVEVGLDLAVGDNTSAAADLLCLLSMGKGIKYVTEIGGDAVKGGSKVKNLYKLASKGTGKGVEQVLDSVKTYEQATNKGIHINIEDFRNGKGADAIKIAIPFEGDEKLFDSLLKHLNK